MKIHYLQMCSEVPDLEAWLCFYSNVNEHKHSCTILFLYSLLAEFSSRKDPISQCFCGVGFLLLGVGGGVGLGFGYFFLSLVIMRIQVITVNHQEKKKKPLEISQSQILFLCSVQSASSLKENFHISRKINAQPEFFLCPFQQGEGDECAELNAHAGFLLPWRVNTLKAFSSPFISVFI